MTVDADFHHVCDSEPIHVPGSVQPHGTLLVLDPGLTVVAASENCSSMFGATASTLLGQTAAGVLGEDGARRLRDALSRPASGPARFPMKASDGRTVDACIHRDAERILIDFEPWEPINDQAVGKLRTATAGIPELRGAPDPESLADAAAKLVRSVTGYDRVLVYRFDEDWNGAVIAESRTDSVPPYLGLSFPASDIPVQARELYRKTEVRHIPDATYAPVPVRSAEGPVDIGISALRSVSPYHLEYMRNMGVRASLVGSVMRGDRLWGLIACHHLQGPRRNTGPERDVFHMICQTVSALMISAEAEALARRRLALAVHQSRLLEAVHHGGIEGLMGGDLVDSLLGVVAADGFVYIAGGEVHRVGSTPSEGQTLALVKLVAGSRNGVFATHCLAEDTGIVDPERHVAGMLVMPLHGRHDILLGWFRDERRRTVHWGGDPNRPVEVDEGGRVSPRKSFEQFLQTIEGQSLVWRPEEIESARRLGELIEVEVQRIHRSRSEFLHSALVTLNEMVLVTEAEPIGGEGHRIVMVSEALERFSGYRAEELIGKTPRIFQGPQTDRAVLERVRAALTRWERVQVELLNYRKDGSSCWVELDIAPIADEKGWYTHWIAVQRDITERKRVEMELAAQRDRLHELAGALSRAKDEAERANEAKSVFLANMSHELRTPMHAIMSFSRLGLDRVAMGEVDRLSRYFGNIHESGARLTSLLNDLLDLSKLEAGRMEMRRDQTDLSQVVNDCIIELEPLAATKKQRIVFPTPAVAVIANVDPVRIGQVLRNLLSNANKFSPEGGRIDIELQALPDAVPPAVRLAVLDEGVGIPESELESVFDKFVQSSKTRTNEGGTGLGLAICRELVIAHGGSIHARQREPRGTVFEMILPVDGQPAVPQA
jgi:PAS domain S-box-containing protein